MTDYVKHLPTAAIPEGAVAAWGVDHASRWLRARLPAVFAPAAGGGLLAGPVLLAVVLTAGPAGGWRAFAGVALLAALPWWFRYLPVATLLAAPVLAAESVLALPHSSDRAVRAGHGLVLALAAWAFAGALVRLRVRRRQRELALAAAGSARFPLPAVLPAAHRRRGLPGVVIGSLCCLAAAPALTHRYGPFAGRLFATALLVVGTTALGRNLTRHLAARRLRRRPQPALLVGVRATASGHRWVHPDADTPAGPPLIAHVPRARDTAPGQRVLLSGSGRGLRADHHDIDPVREPFQAVLYGAVYEGAEVVLESAVYETDVRIVSQVTAAPLLPRRHHGPSGWKPSGRSHREAVREQARREEERRRERARERAQSRSSDSSTGGGCGGGGGCDGGSCGGCGGCGGCG
ncbi:hypothetical protein [Streptomyces venezuelae]|uniref:hypothetical protein n=1 Tax=Streptomyces venezuelae TaxID=54571 RepID=UPI0016834004|nr:hypothetical protein [Streptomyces venezuelae]